MKRANGKYVLFMDADLSTPLPEILNFLNTFRENPETQVLIGDRRSSTNTEEQGRSIFRRAISYTFNRLVQAVSVKGIEDPQCGFKAFTSEANKQIFQYQSLNGFAFDVEVLVLAEKLGFKTVAQPVRWIDDDRTHVHPIWDPLRKARDLIKVRRVVRENLSRQKASGN